MTPGLFFPVAQQMGSEWSGFRNMLVPYDGLSAYNYFKLPWETGVLSVNHFWQLYLSFWGIIMTQIALREEYLLQ